MFKDLATVLKCFKKESKELITLPSRIYIFALSKTKLP